MSKGYVFSTDAMLAIIVFVIFFTVSTNFFLGTTELSFSRVSMKRIAIDALDALDELDSLESMDKAIITEKIGRAFPERVSWKMAITQYSLNKGAFKNEKEISFGDTTASLAARDVVKAKRLFLTFASGEIYRYNTAELWVWLK